MSLFRCILVETIVLVSLLASPVLGNRPFARDMASLYSVSDAVIKVGPLQSIGTTGRVHLASAVVAQVYKGEAATGTTVIVALQLPIPAANHKARVTHDKPQHKTVESFGPQRGVLLFLNRVEGRKAADYICHIAGAKYVWDRTVLSYARFGSFSPFVLVVQTPERIEVPAAQGYGWDELLKDLSAAKEYAQLFQEVTSRRATPDELNAFASDPVERRHPGVSSHIAERARAIMRKRGIIIGPAQPDKSSVRDKPRR